MVSVYKQFRMGFLQLNYMINVMFLNSRSWTSTSLPRPRSDVEGQTQYRLMTNMAKCGARYHTIVDRYSVSDTIIDVLLISVIVCYIHSTLYDDVTSGIWPTFSSRVSHAKQKTLIFMEYIVALSSVVFYFHVGLRFALQFCILLFFVL